MAATSLLTAECAEDAETCPEPGRGVWLRERPANNSPADSSNSLGTSFSSAVSAFSAVSPGFEG